MIALYLDQVNLRQGARVLHLAPEEGLYNRIRKRSEVAQYTVADKDPSNYDFVECSKIDLCALEDWPSDYYDVILHSHVLEHTGCNIAYTLFHLHRMLRPTGRHLFVVPFTVGRYEESFQRMTGEERTRRFGQWDHVRRFGVEDIGDHLGRIVRMPESFDAVARFGRDALEQANIPQTYWRGWNAASVIDVSKGDYKLR